MFANYIQLLFVISAYSPVILILWTVNMYNLFNDSHYKIELINKFEEIFNMLNIIYLFLFLILICWLIIRHAHNSLTINSISIKSIKSADFNMGTLIFSYFLPCIELFKKDILYTFLWLFILVIIIIILKGSYFYNPILKLFGYKYYEITTKNEVTYIMLSKQKLVNPKSIKAYSQLTDYVILNNS